MDAVRWDGRDLMLSVKVVAGASREGILAEADFIRVRVHAPAREGKANKRLAKMLAGVFGVAPSDVILERGQTARTKTIRVRSPSRLPSFIHH